jgi:hypothetical protein
MFFVLIGKSTWPSGPVMCHDFAKIEKKLLLSKKTFLAD